MGANLAAVEGLLIRFALVKPMERLGSIGSSTERLCPSSANEDQQSYSHSLKRHAEGCFLHSDLLSLGVAGC